VQYGQLVEIGRRLVDERVPRPRRERVLRWLLREGLTSALCAPALRVGQWLRPLLPAVLKAKVPPRAATDAQRWPTREHPRKVLLLLGCVQPALAPNISAATARVLDAAGIQTLVADGAGCCGAVRSHGGDHEGGLADMRRNIDAWWPLVQGLTSQGRVEAIVVNASGCTLAVKEYGHALAHDAHYAEKARRVSALARDLSELLPGLVEALRPRVSAAHAAQRLAYHPPCTLQHGQQVRGVVEEQLARLGFDVRLPAESHLCCGSAGTYSVLQPALAGTLRERKLGHLEALAPQCVVSANIGCIAHLQSGTATPVRHWIEVLDKALKP
jgi:glycolate oxidase iron-sulfur subunit